MRNDAEAVFGAIRSVYHEHGMKRLLDGREEGDLLPLAVFVFWVGLYPKPFLAIIDSSVTHLLQQVYDKGSGP